MSNSFGRFFKVHSFGESHGPALGAVIEGCPAGVVIDQERLTHFLGRRRPGGNALVSARNELDQPEVLSGIFQGKTLGTPIAILIRNQDARSKDYESVQLDQRAGHATDLWHKKYGHSDPRGSGRASGRETVARVAAGAIALQLLEQDPVAQSIVVLSFVRKMGPFELQQADLDQLLSHSSSHQSAHEYVDSFAARFPCKTHSESSKEITEYISNLKNSGDSVGGVIETWILGCPAGLGEPVFDKLKSRLASAILGIGAFSGFELGTSPDQALGSQFHKDLEVYGGIRGGLSDGGPIRFRSLVKPTSSILDVAKKGRHDPAILIRAVPVVDAMVALTLADFVLGKRLNSL